MQATNRRERRGRGQQDRSKQVDSLSDLPQLVQDGIELGTFVVKLGDALSQFADLGDKSRVVVEDPRYCVGALSARRIQLGGFDQAGFEVDSASHNRPYVTRRLEPEAVSRRRST
ncbi:hypothetical protein [Pseudomonas sp. SCT]|uniref:hypothetical protein n=1 Tax=Pseudomonas sp. (strain SCT) TaxID=412955 RepID=UPI00135C0DC6|nr:hypothetical protein [Pseudomonas sp. SCT]